MFSVVWAVSDPRLLSVAALSAGAHSPRVYLIGGISSLSGDEPHYLEATCSQHKAVRKHEQLNFLNLLSRIFLCFVSQFHHLQI